MEDQARLKALAEEGRRLALEVESYRAAVRNALTQNPPKSAEPSLWDKFLRGSPNPPVGPPVEAVESESETWFGQKWLLVFGVLLLMIGAGLFLKYAFEQQLFPPSLRCAGTFLFGLTLAGAGYFGRSRLHPFFGNALIGGGFAIMYIAGYLAHSLYGLVPGLGALLYCVVVTALAMAAALRFRSQPLGILSMTGAYLAPFLLYATAAHVLFLPAYLLIIALGALAVCHKADWHFAASLSFFLTQAIFITWYERHYANAIFWPTLLFGTSYFAIYSVIPYLRIFGGKDAPRDAIVMMIFNSLVLAAFSSHTIDRYAGEKAAGVYFLWIAAYFVSLGYLIRTAAPAAIRAIVTMDAQAIAFALLAVPMLVSDDWITLFWALQASGLAYLHRHQSSRLIVGFVIVILFGLTMKEVIDLIEIDHWTEKGISRAINHIGVIGALLFARRAIREGIFDFLLHAAIFLIASFETALFFDAYAPRASFAAISILWGIWSGIYLGVGFAKKISWARRFAVTLLFVTGVKVIMIDMHNASTPYRILSFVIVGLFLIAASYLYYRMSDREPRIS